MHCKLAEVLDNHIGDIYYLIFILEKNGKCKALITKFSLPKHTVKLARAKLPAKIGHFTCSSHVKNPHTQFTCVTCSLLVKTGKFTCVYKASTSRRIHANCLQPHVNLLEYNGYFTGIITYGIHANLPTTSMQNCLLLQAKITANAGKNPRLIEGKIPAKAHKITCNSGNLLSHRG